MKHKTKFSLVFLALIAFVTFQSNTMAGPVEEQRCQEYAKTDEFDAVFLGAASASNDLFTVCLQVGDNNFYLDPAAEGGEVIILRSKVSAPEEMIALYRHVSGKRYSVNHPDDAMDSKLEGSQLTISIHGDKVIDIRYFDPQIALGVLEFNSD